MELVLSSWFSCSRSIEIIKIGTENESAVLTALYQHAFVVILFKCGLFAKSNPWMAASQVALVVITISDNE
jgi:hypothetical protein